MPTARVNAVDLYYEIHGSGEPLILTHGAWGDATGWQAVIPGLAEHFEVVVWDRRGHSRSSLDDGSGTLQQDADDLAGLIGYLGRRRVHVYGSSAGGTVVLKLLATHPEVVSTAAIHEPAVPALLETTLDGALARDLAEQNRHLEIVVDLIDAGEWRSAAEYFIDNVAVGAGAWERFPEEVRSRFAANAGTFAGEMADPLGLTVDVRAIEACEVPLLLTIGTDSPPVLQAAGRELARRAPSIRVETLDGTGHVPYRTHPEMWLDRALAYFEAAPAIGR